MTPELLKEIAQQMRDDNPEASGQMTASSRAAAKAIHALADAIDKVAERAERENPRDLKSPIETCVLCGRIVGHETSGILAHYRNYHPRSYAAVKEQLDQ